MIPKDFITEWREQAPWITDAQVEQDLVISRALVEIFMVRPASHRGMANRKTGLRIAPRARRPSVTAGRSSRSPQGG